MADITVVLEGGSRDGESTVVDGEVTRVLAVSEAPGLLDVYQVTERQEELPGNDDPAFVFEFTGHESAEDVPPEALHMPDRG